jgi:hypothetical protein
MHFGLLNTVSSNKFEIRVGRDFIMKLATCNLRQLSSDLGQHCTHVYSDRDIKQLTTVTAKQSTNR